MASVRYLMEVEDFDRLATSVQVARERKEDGVASYRRAAAPLPGLPRGMRLRRHFNQDSLPRAYLVERFQVLDRESTLARVAVGDFDYHGEVLLERHPGFEPTPGAGSHRPARITDYAAERVEITAETEEHALLVLTDTHYPGWRARVDGAEVEILRANALFRAVALPPGRHQVVFEYTPASLRNGLWIASGSAAGLALAPMAGQLRRRRRSQESALRATVSVPPSGRHRRDALR